MPFSATGANNPEAPPAPTLLDKDSMSYTLEPLFPKADRRTLASDLASCLSRSMALSASGAGQPVQASNLEKSRSSSGPVQVLGQVAQHAVHVVLDRLKGVHLHACAPQLVPHVKPNTQIASLFAPTAWQHCSEASSLSPVHFTKANHEAGGLVVRTRHFPLWHGGTRCPCATMGCKLW